MAQLNLRIEMSDDDKAAVSTLIRSAQEADREKWRTRILNERIRTIEQVKRLYAVVMGFAVISCITNAYQSARILQAQEPYAWDGYTVLAAQVISFVSLITLFVLGAERMLDRRYLLPESPCPKWMSLWFDLFALGIAALWFLILANAIPPAAPPATNFKATLYTEFKAYSLYLAILYALDVVFLAIQAITLFLEDRRRPPAQRLHRGLLKAHRTWIVINLIGLAVMVAVMLWVPMDHPVSSYGYSLHVGALAVLGWHVLRFFVDFGKTFDFYYPPENPNVPP
jgi:hypothetical protein